VSDAFADTRFALFVLGVLSALALVLAAVGVYGVVAYATARRTHEIALRLALGADGCRIVGLVIRDGLGWTAAGIVAGVLGPCPVALPVVAALSRRGARPADLPERGDAMLALRSE
jgi:ABC-type lipoprotein release transport system permease subunit